jgi:hypothetical protein
VTEHGAIIASWSFHNCQQLIKDDEKESDIPDN